MTRDEAIDRVEAVYYGLRKHPLGPGAQAVDVLVVLGLLKLDEPKRAHDEAFETVAHRIGMRVDTSDIALVIDCLNANGFKIVKA